MRRCSETEGLSASLPAHGWCEDQVQLTGWDGNVLAACFPVAAAVRTRDCGVIERPALTRRAAARAICRPVTARSQAIWKAHTPPVLGNALFAA